MIHLGWILHEDCISSIEHTHNSATGQKLDCIAIFGGIWGMILIRMIIGVIGGYQ